MDLNQILQILDTLDYTETEEFLQNQMERARAEEDGSTLLSLLNEMIGFCRDSCQFDKTKKYEKEIREQLERQKLYGSKAYATSLLNIANAQRASGDLEASLSNYKEVFGLYEKLLPPGDFLFASLNNNMSLLYQEMGDFEAACECLKRALEITRKTEGAEIETAITCTNLAQSLLILKKTEQAADYIEEALTRFHEDGDRDYHYSAALSVYAQLKFGEEKYQEAADYFEQAMQEFEKHMGKGGNYEVLKQNRDMALSHLKPQAGLAVCEQFFWEYGLPDFKEKFPEDFSQMAFGLVGEGSECFGFDDAYSRDHDWGPGFCIWVTEELWEKIGTELQRAYDELINRYASMQRNTTRQGSDRTGVMTIRDFYRKFLPYSKPESDEEWFALSEENLATVTNGKVFLDNLGAFTEIRNHLKKYYPDSVFRKKLSYELIRAAQTGQYNFTRMRKRGELVTARLYLSEFMEHVLHIIYLLNRQYAPYKKWLHKGAAGLTVLPELTDVLNALNDFTLNDENVPLTIEIIAQLILAQMQKEGLIMQKNEQDENYLEPYGRELLKGELVERLVSMEWKAFDQVKNEGGRASCQDDWNTFSIMRKSQYMEWTEEMLQSYINDFEAAESRDWNLITEKYGRMMESTTPEKYEKIKGSLPILSEQKKAVIEEIVKIQVGFMEQFAKEYPKVAGTARSIHTSEDNPCNTSYETYLRGELGTYSDETLALYGRFIVAIAQAGGNPAQNIMRNTALLYGYKSLTELEEKL